MILFIYGDDIKKVKEKITATVDALLAKQKDASVFKIEGGSWRSEYVQELLNAQGLFLSKYIIVFNFISENKEAFSELVDFLPQMKSADHVCIIAEGNITEKNKEKIKKVAQKSQELLLKKIPINEPRKNEAPTFAFAMSFANREFQKTEKYFHALLDLKLAPEEVHGVLWWQMKAVRLASTAQSAVGADLGPYVFKNAKSASLKWKAEDLDQVLNSLFEMYHLAHRGKIDFYNTIERLIVRWGR
ncbi:MAG: hypothetical protein WCG97_00805 [bacterium]